MIKIFRTIKRTALDFAPSAIVLAIVVGVAAPQLPESSEASAQTALDPRVYHCGFDPVGAEEHRFTHKLNLLRAKEIAASTARAAKLPGPRALTVGDVAVIEDDGSIVMPPSKFDLKNRSFLYIPEEGGYRISGERVPYNPEVGARLNFFFGVDGELGAGKNDGYRQISVPTTPFTFYGVSYDTINVGINGYITFGGGDTAARGSVVSLASGPPRIAALWADLDVSSKGAIYYNRFSDRHLISWEGAKELPAGGANTFQVTLFDDGRIGIAYKKIKSRAALVGLAPGGAPEEAEPIDFSDPPTEVLTSAFYETFSKQKRLDLPQLTRAFYSEHPDQFDTLFVWTDFPFDNGLGVARAFNVRNDIRGIGLRLFDRSETYGSSRLSTLLSMGDIANNWPSDPQAHVVGLNSAVSIVCHEQGHRWLSYVHFDAEHDIKDDLLGRERAHWSFLMDTRTEDNGSFSSLMEGNSWRENSSGTFTTVQTAVNYFNALDLYLMGLIPAEEVPPITFLTVEEEVKQILRSKSPVSNFSLSAARKTTSVAQIVEREGARVPDSTTAPKKIRIAFILLTEQGAAPSNATLAKVERYREAIVRYFAVATGRRGSLDSSLEPGDEQ